MSSRISSGANILSSDALGDFLKDCRLLVVLGIGNELKGDDAVGIEIVKRIKKDGRVKAFAAHTVPDSFVMPVIREKPSHVLIADAAMLDMKPGGWRLIDGDSISESMFGTHLIPLTAVGKRIAAESGAKVAYICVQPKALTLGSKLSTELAKTARDIAKLIMADTKKEKES